MNNTNAHVLSAHNNRFPTSKRDYTLVTPMMEDLLAIVTQEVDNMETGISIWSASRFGKTRALDYVESETNKKAPTVSVVRIIMTTAPRDSDRKFFMHFFPGTEPEENFIGDGFELRSRVERKLLVRCAESQDPRLLMIIDEAQRMALNHFSYLIDLTNQLERLGMAPTVMLVGQPELIDLRDLLLKKKRQDAIGRFLEDPIAFEGITTQAILKKILSHYDSYLMAEFPIGSQICITESYVPAFFRAGFRLGECDEPFWHALTSTSAKLNAPVVVGMKSLTRAVELALTELAISKNSAVAGNTVWWEAILLQSGYLRRLKTFSPQQQYDSP